MALESMPYIYGDVEGATSGEGSGFDERREGVCNGEDDDAFGRDEAS